MRNTKRHATFPYNHEWRRISLRDHVSRGSGDEEREGIEKAACHGARRLKGYERNSL